MWSVRNSIHISAGAREQADHQTYLLYMAELKWLPVFLHSLFNRAEFCCLVLVRKILLTHLNCFHLPSFTVIK